MREYRDPENKFSVQYPDGWLPLTHEGTPHVSLASLTTGGYLKIEAHQFDPAQTEEAQPEKTIRALVGCELRNHPELAEPVVQLAQTNGSVVAHTTFTRQEVPGEDNAADFGHTRAWVIGRGAIQVRCLYRCRSADKGTDDDELAEIIGSLQLNDTPHLDATSFTLYYYTLLKHKRPMLGVRPPENLTLILEDGQTILLEHLYNHYLLEPERME